MWVLKVFDWENWVPAGTGADLQKITSNGNVTTKDIEAKSFITTGGDNTQAVLWDWTLILLSDISPDLSGYIPYGIDVDLGIYNFTTTGTGTFGTTLKATLNDWVNLAAVYAEDTINGWTAYLSGSIGAGYFWDSSGNNMAMATGSYAFYGNGKGYLSSDLELYGGLFSQSGGYFLGTLLLGETSPFDNSVIFEAYGKGGFNNWVQSVYFATGTNSIDAVGDANISGNIHFGTQVYSLNNNASLYEDPGDNSGVLYIYGLNTFVIGNTAQSGPYSNHINTDDGSASFSGNVSALNFWGAEANFGILYTSYYFLYDSVNSWYGEITLQNSIYNFYDSSNAPASVQAAAFITYLWLSSDFVKGDGSLDDSEYIEDAPSDGTTYWRKDWAWSAAWGWTPTLSDVLSAWATFEAFNKNLKSYPYNIVETSWTVTTITYTTWGTPIVKTITEVSSAVTTIVFSWIPAWIPTTKTITIWTGTAITYS